MQNRNTKVEFWDGADGDWGMGGGLNWHGRDGKEKTGRGREMGEGD